MKPILEIQNISKKFRIQHEKQAYLSIRDSISSLFKPSNSSEDFYALKDISFDVYPGESIGIIGKNGAGKSTLLKILSKITPPTSGKIISRGRMASLLEVGTGFHPELTGRENVFLNGSILGMKQKEIKSKFDEIIDFSGVEKFLDTPLKHYSSGMQLRLAFAVAAFLEPEILVIDEVLAVGDAEFQKKCLGKMEDVSKSGKTILFVSHNFNQVNHLCKRSIYLKEGTVYLDGNSDDIISEYNKYSIDNKNSDLQVKGYVIDSKNWDNQKELIIEVSWPKYKFEPGWECDVACYTTERVKVFAVQSQLINNFSSTNPENNCIRFNIKNNNFAERNYFFDIGIRKNRNEEYHIILENCLHIATTGFNLPIYKRNDVIIVPEINIETLSLDE